MKRFLIGSISVLLVSATPAIAQAETFSLQATAIAQESTERNKIIAQGTFTTTEQNHPTAGTATIVKEGGKHFLVFDNNFTTANGPDVQVVLHRTRPVPVKLQEENYIAIAALKSTEGEQRYEIPENIDLDKFDAVSIWCREFNVSFGYAGLN